MIINKVDITNLIDLFSKKQKLFFSIFIVLSLISMGLEILGIYLLVPLMGILTGSKIGSDKVLDFINSNLSFFSDTLLNLVIIILIIFTLKNFYSIFLEFYKFKFAANLKVKLTKKLFANYIHRPILFHLNNNSSKLIRNIEDLHTIINLTKGIMLLFTEICVVIGLLGFLIYFQTAVAISAIFFLSSTSYIFYKFIQNKTTQAGKIKQKNDGLRIMHMLQAFGALKDIKILNKENYFIKKFSNHDTISVHLAFIHNFLLSLPKLIIEWILIVGVVLFISFVILQDKDYSYLITILGIFIAAAFRLMPSVTRIMNAIQAINFFRPVAKTLKNDSKNQIYITKII